MTPAETLAIYIALIGIPVFGVFLAWALAAAAKNGDRQIEDAERMAAQRRWEA